MPGGSCDCCPVTLPLLACCGMPWLGCTAAIFSTCYFLNLLHSILLAPICGDGAPIVQLLCRTRLYSGVAVGIRGGWVRRGGSSWTAGAVYRFTSCRGGQSQARKAQCWREWWWWCRAGRAKGSHGGVWLLAGGRRKGARAIARVVTGSGAASGKCFDGRTRYDALLLAVELVGSSCHAGCSLLLLPWPRCEAGEAGAIARTARALAARCRPDAHMSRDINAYEQRALCQQFPFLHATIPVDPAMLMVKSSL